jgi:hypothetical protein
MSSDIREERFYRLDSGKCWQFGSLLVEQYPEKSID